MNPLKLKFTVSILILALLYTSGPSLAQELSPYGNRFTWVTIGSVRLKAEVVDTPEKTYLGLGYRQDLPKDRGMLFVMPEEEVQQFCMRGMQFAIDILWLGPSRVVGLEQDVRPGDPRTLASPEPVRYVLEVKAGFCRRQGIKAGDQVHFDLEQGGGKGKQ